MHKNKMKTNGINDSDLLSGKQIREDLQQISKSH